MNQTTAEFAQVEQPRVRWWQNYFLILIAAVMAHLWLIFIGQNGTGTPMGDILFAYEPWVNWMIKTHHYFGLDTSWVYPYPAQIPMWIARLINPNDFQAGWLTMTTILDLLAISVLVRFGKRDADSHINYVAAWFWICFLVALGPVSISRIDAITAVVAIFGVVQMTRRHLTASTSWFTLATWMKVWPVALLAGAVAGSRHWMRVILTAAAFSAGVVVLGFMLGGNFHMFGFLKDQQIRGLQLEAQISSVFIWAAQFGLGNAISYYDQKMMTFQISGQGTAVVASLMGIALALAFAITFWLTWRAKQAGRHYSEIMPIATLTAVLDLIFFNKVGSPQYVTWLAIPVILGVLYRTPRWKLPMMAVAIIAALTELIYPTFYGLILQGKPAGLLLLLIRNVGYLLLLIYANVRLSSLGAKQSADQPHLAQ
ncbi:MAG: glycosyltransferase 87 family protein [Micrococcales bacterium]